MDISRRMAELNILRISGRVKQLRLNTAHKISYKQATKYLDANFKRAKDRAQPTKRSQWNYIVPKIRGAESKTFCFSAIKDWDSLPEQLKKCENITPLKNGVKRHLRQMAAEEANRDFLFLKKKKKKKNFKIFLQYKFRKLILKKIAV